MGWKPEEGLETLKGFVSLVVDDLEVLLESLREGVIDVAGFGEEFAFDFTFLIYCDVANHFSVMTDLSLRNDIERYVVVVETMNIVVVFGILAEERIESSYMVEYADWHEPTCCIDIMNWVFRREGVDEEVIEEGVGGTKKSVLLEVGIKSRAIAIEMDRTEK